MATFVSSWSGVRVVEEGRRLCSTVRPLWTMSAGPIHRFGAGPPGLKGSSQATVHAGVVHLAPQAADDRTLTDRRNEDAASQARQVLGKIDGLLAEAGSDKSRLLSMTIWISDASYGGPVDREYEHWLQGVEGRPVRAMVQNIPFEPSTLVEIMVTAAAAPSVATVIETDQAAAAVGPYNQGIRSRDGLIFASGCIGLDPKTAEFAGDTVEEQTHQVLRNLWAILEAGGASRPGDIIKTTILLDDIADFSKVNAIYKDFFGDDQVPARATFSAKALPKGAKVEIEAIAQAQS